MNPYSVMEKNSRKVQAFQAITTNIVGGRRITRSLKLARRVGVTKIFKGSALSKWMKSWETKTEARGMVASTSSAKPEKLPSEPQLSQQITAWVWV